MNKKFAHKIIYLLVIPVVLFFAFAACPNPIDNNLVTLVEDVLAPVVTITEPGNYSQYKSTISISGMVEDSSTTTGDNQGSVSTLSYEVQGHYLLAGQISLSADGQFGPVDIDATELSGREVIVITAEDWNGNISEEEIILDENTSGPYIDIPGDNFLYTSQLAMSGTIANSDSDSAITEVKSITWEVLTRPDLTETLNFDVSGDGTFTVEPLAATINYSDPNDFDFTVNTVDLEKTMYISVTTEDWKGHTTEIVRTIYDGKTGPYIEISSPNDGEHYHGTVTITGIVQNGPSDTGLDSVELLTCVLFVNGGDEGTIAFINSLPAFTPNDGSIAFTPGANTFSITLSTTSPVIINDDYLRISIWAEDKTGKTNTDNIDLVKSDGPYLSISAPESYTPYTTTLSITGTVKSWDGAPDAFEIDTLTYSLGAAVDQPLAFNAAGTISDSLTTSTLSGDQTLTIKATDDNGNQITTSISLTDGLAPILTVNSPGASYDGTDLTVSGTVYDYVGADSAVYVATLTYSLGAEVDQPLSFTTATGMIPDTLLDTSAFYGEQTLTIKATDDDGNLSDVSFSLADGIDPQLVITAPADNDPYGPSVNITGTVRSNPGITGVDDIASVSYQIGTIAGTLIYNTSGSINETIDLSALSGNQTLTITATDDDGNLSTPVEIDLTDGVAPVLDITAPPTGASYGSSLTVSGTVLDYVGASGAGDVKTLSYTIGGLSGTLGFNTIDGQIIEGSGGNPIDTSSLSGNQTLTITAKDKETPTANESQVLVELVE